MPLNKIIKTWDDFQEAKDYLSGVDDKTRLAVDTETCGKLGADLSIKPALRHDSILLGFSVSRSVDSGFYIPYYINPRKLTIWEPQQLLEIREWFKGLLRSEARWVMHNSMFDMRVLRKNFCRVKNLVFDTQVAAHELDENRSLALKELGSSIFGIDAKAEKLAIMTWAKEHPEVFGTSKPSEDLVMGQLYKVPLDIYATYAIKDTMLTYQLYIHFAKELMARGMVKRYQVKHALLPVYQEINEQGWPIDETILERNGSKIAANITDCYTQMHAVMNDKITIVESEVLDKSMPIKNSSAWKAAIIEKEGFTDYFTVPSKGKNGKALKDAGKFSTKSEYCENFLGLVLHQESLTHEFLKWDGTDKSRLSPELRSELYSIQKHRLLTKRHAEDKKKEKINCPFVFNFNSDHQISRLLFDLCGLPVLRRTEKTQSPDVSSDVIKILQKNLIKDLSLQDVWNSKLDLKDNIDRLSKYYAGRIDFSTTTPILIDTTCWDLTKVKLIIFLDLLLTLSDREKLYGTYIIGLKKRLYSHEDLGRKPEYNPANGAILKYVISNVNPTGTTTGRPSSTNPNQLNFTKDALIKEFFVAPAGYKIGSADYESQEVRQATNIAFDPDMKNLFTIKCEACGALQPEEIRQRIVLDVYKKLTGDVPHDSVKCPKCSEFKWSVPDPHSLNVQRIWPEFASMSLKDIKKNHPDKRTIAKMVQFQTLYGGSGNALAESLGIDVQSATAIQKAFFRGARKIEEAIEKTRETARKFGYIETIGGYRRHLPDIQLARTSKVEPPVLDPVTASYNCFGQVDHYPEVNRDGAEVYLSKKRCPLGNKTDCKFFKKCSDTFKRTNANKLRARAERQAFNVLIQGGSADVTNRALANIYAMRAKLAKVNPEWKKVRILSNIYDAIYLLVPETLIPQDTVDTPIEQNYFKVLRWAMEETYPNMFVPLTCELEKPGATWADCH
jgi:DNA polymerase I-like protein with 3'-5' exonuclease and polymerase domains